MRTKQRVILKMLLVLAQRAKPRPRSILGRLAQNLLRESPDREMDDAAEKDEQQIKILNLFYTLAHLNGEFLAEDSQLLSEWNYLVLTENSKNFYRHVRVVVLIALENSNFICCNSKANRRRGTSVYAPTISAKWKPFERRIRLLLSFR